MSLLPVVFDMIRIVKTMINYNRIEVKNTERCLVNVLVFPLVDVAMPAVKLNKDVLKYDKCDIETLKLKKPAKMYLYKHREKHISMHDKTPIKCHSKSNLNILVDYFFEKNFDNNWEKIFWDLKLYDMRYQSFTRKIISERCDNVFTLPVKNEFREGNDQRFHFRERSLLVQSAHFNAILDLEKVFSDTLRYDIQCSINNSKFYCHK